MNNHERVRIESTLVKISLFPVTGIKCIDVASRDYKWRRSELTCEYDLKETGPILGADLILTPARERPVVLIADRYVVKQTDGTILNVALLAYLERFARIVELPVELPWGRIGMYLARYLQRFATECTDNDDPIGRTYRCICEAIGTEVLIKRDEGFEPESVV